MARAQGGLPIDAGEIEQGRFAGARNFGLLAIRAEFSPLANGAVEALPMPGAGTDKTKEWEERPGPVIVLVEPQLGENIGAAARAMANFGLSRLRLVAPRQRWPNDKARMMAAGADRILDGAALFDSLEQAIADCTFVVAATARAHDQAKPVVSAPEAAAPDGAAGCRRRNRRRRVRP